MSKVYFARVGHAGPSDVRARMPELAPLSNATICVFGLGCLGAPSALEFARCGVRELRILDHDFVDPATICRWPLGIQSVGLQKADALTRYISREYPFTEIIGASYYLGAVRDTDDPGVSGQEAMHQFTAGASLIYDATAEVGIQHYLSDFAADSGIPYIGVDATPGGWGGRIIRITPQSTAGCYYCYRCAQANKLIPDPPMHPEDEIQPVGCADPTFTGASFDLVQVSLMGVRMAVSTLCSPKLGGYPEAKWDVTIISLRGDEGDMILPHYQGFQIERNPECSRCNLD